MPRVDFTRHHETMPEKVAKVELPRRKERDHDMHSSRTEQVHNFWMGDQVLQETGRRRDAFLKQPLQHRNSKQESQVSIVGFESAQRCGYRSAPAHGMECFDRQFPPAKKKSMSMGSKQSNVSVV